MANSQEKSSPDRIHPKFSNEELAEAIASMSDDQRAMWLTRVESALRKRKIQLLGYLLALVVWAVGMVFALAYYGISEGFTGWVFLVPFGLVGLILYVFGKWAEKVGNIGKEPPPEKR